jgi:hypothetical protein
MSPLCTAAAHCSIKAGICFVSRRPPNSSLDPRLVGEPEHREDLRYEE